MARACNDGKKEMGNGMTEIECVSCGIRDWSPSNDLVLVQKWLRCNTISKEKDGCGGIMTIVDKEFDIKER